MQESALDIIKKMPLFSPAILKGKKVRSLHCIEIVNCIDRKIAISSHAVFQCNPSTDDLCYSFNPCNDLVANYDNKAQSYSDPLPYFVGGNDSMNSFISNSIKYPLNAKENGVEGRVLVSFVVEKDGSLSNFLVVKGIGWGCDEEAIRIVKSFPKWIPGKSNNQIIMVEMTIPISFSLK
jgi:TonB family protein